MNKQAQTHPIATLETTVEFREACRKHGFETFEELLEIQSEDLTGKYCFSMHNLMEFVEIARKLGLEDEIKEGDWW